VALFAPSYTFLSWRAGSWELMEDHVKLFGVSAVILFVFQMIVVFKPDAVVMPLPHRATHPKHQRTLVHTQPSR